MCTATWINDSNGYTFYFNRDELKTRKTALPPRIVRRKDCSYIAPRDGDAGGSWIAVNDYGFSVAVLNNYPNSVKFSPDGKQSRGRLILDVAGLSGIDSLLGTLDRKDLSVYMPFHMLALQVRKPVALITWDGQTLDYNSNADNELPFTTSSFKPLEVIKERKELFWRVLADGEVLDSRFLERYHRSYDPVKGGHSVCMLRPDAETMSMSRIRVDYDQAEMVYWPKISGTFRFASPVVKSLELAGKLKKVS